VKSTVGRYIMSTEHMKPNTVVGLGAAGEERRRKYTLANSESERPVDPHP
jgi:hypothetical protein